MKFLKLDKLFNSLMMSTCFFKQDLTGAIVSYSINVKLVLSGMGGELDIDLPFKLFHARPSIQTA